MPASGVAAEQVTPVENVIETPEVTNPESNEVEQQPQEKPEQDDSDKSLKRLQRRVDRVTAARYQAEARAQQLEQELERFRQQTQSQEAEQQTRQIRPEDVDRIATERATYMREMESVSKRSGEIRDALVKSVGSERVQEILFAVIEETGPLARDDGRWTPLGEAIADCEAPAAVLKYLAENPDTAAELNGLSATRLGRRLDAIERDLKATKVSKAPQPLQPVTGKGAPVGKSEREMTDAEWYAQRFKRK